MNAAWKKNERNTGMILISNGGENAHRVASPGGSMAIGTVDGVFLLESKSAQNWFLRGRALEGIFVSGLTQLEDGRLFAATHGCGIARSDDAGRSWRFVNNGITQFDAWAIRSGRLRGEEVLIAGTMPAALFISRDGGESWSELTALREVPDAHRWFFPPPPHQGHVKEIVIQGDRLYVGIEVGALLVSEDGGGSFRALPVDPDPAEVDMHRIAVHPDRPGRIIVSNGLVGMMESHDDGTTWQRNAFAAELDYPEPMVAHPDQPDLIFVGGAVGWPPHWYRLGRARGRIARSTNGGKSWTTLLGGLPNGQRAMWGGLTLEAWTDGYALYAADTDGQVFASRDGGETWCMIAEVAPVSKGDFYRGLAKGRPRIANVDDMMFFDAAKDRMGKVEV